MYLFYCISVLFVLKLGWNAFGIQRALADKAEGYGVSIAIWVEIGLLVLLAILAAFGEAPLPAGWTFAIGVASILLSYLVLAAVTAILGLKANRTPKG